MQAVADDELGAKLPAFQPGGGYEAVPSKEFVIKPRILLFVRYYLPGYKAGGPMRSIANLAAHLGDEFDLQIVSTDRDLGDEESYTGVTINEWNTAGKAKVLYLSPERRNLDSIVQVIRNSTCDAIYLNSFFDPDFTIKPLLARRLGILPDKPVIVAPRGEFSAGALVLKALKKRGYIAAAKLAGLYSGVTWHASTDHEVQDIHETFGADRNQVRVAVDLPPPTDGVNDRPRRRSRSLCDPFCVCFLSRISPMKNLDFALRVLCRVTVPVQFDIWGPIGEQDYWEECQALVRKLPENVTVRYNGSIKHEQVTEAIAGYDLFFLPTRGENYGHVILEALTAGTPVLIADTTPWRNLAEHGVGWELPLNDEHAFAAQIEGVANASRDTLAEMRRKAQSFAVRHIENREAVEINRRLFLDVCHSGHERQR